MMAGVPADTQGSTALKALATERTSNCILQSANLLQLLRNSSHSEIVAKLPKDLSSKVPNIKTTGELLEQMPSVIVALDAHLDSAFQRYSVVNACERLVWLGKDCGTSMLTKKRNPTNEPVRMSQQGFKSPLEQGISVKGNCDTEDAKSHHVNLVLQHKVLDSRES